MSTTTNILCGAILLVGLVPHSFADTRVDAGHQAVPAGKVFEANAENSIYAGPKLTRDEPGRARHADRSTSNKEFR